MESRLSRSRIVDHQLKDSLLSPTTSQSHTSPPFEFYDNRQRLLRDSGLPVAGISIDQVVAKKLQQELRERGDSKIPIYVTLAKSSLSASPEDGSQRVPSREQWTGHESRQDLTNSAERESRTQSKPNNTFMFDQSNSERSDRDNTEHRLPVETLIAAKEERDEIETMQASKWLGSNEMFAVSRVRDLKHKFEAVGEEQSKRKLERQKVRKEEVQNSLSKDEPCGQQTAPLLDVGKTNEPLTNEMAVALKKRDLSAFQSQQQSTSNHPPSRRWTSLYPRSVLSLSTQRQSIVNMKSEALFDRGERLEQPSHQPGKSDVRRHENHYGRLVVVQETTDEQQPGNNGPTSTDEQFLGNQNSETKIDSRCEKSGDCSLSLPDKNFSREKAEMNSNRTRLASKKLDQPKETDGFINPVGRVHSEPLTSSSLRQSPLRRRIFETKSDKTVSQTANSGQVYEEEEEDRYRDRLWYKKSEETKGRRAEGHRSLTDHRVEGTRVAASRGFNFDDSIEGHKEHQQNDELVSCLRANSIQDQDGHAEENSQLSIVVEDKEPNELLTKAQVDNADEQKQQPGVDETRSKMTSLYRHHHPQRAIDKGKPLSTLPSPSFIARGVEAGVETLQPPPALAPSSDYSATTDRHCLRSDWRSCRNRLTRPKTYSSLSDFYLRSSRPRRIRMRRLAALLSTDHPNGPCSSSIVQPTTQKKTQPSVSSESSVDSSSRCAQLTPPPSPSPSPPPPPPPPPSPSHSANQSSIKRTKASCKLRESNFTKSAEEAEEAHPVQPVICRRTISKEISAEQTSQAVESDNGLVHRQNKVSLEDSWHGSAPRHRLPKETTAQTSSVDLTENDEQIEAMSVKPADETSKDQLELKNDAEFAITSLQTQIDQNEKFMTCAEFTNLPEEYEPFAEPVRTSQWSAKPVSGFISMYRTHGPIRAQFPDRIETVIDSKTTVVLPTNISTQKTDPCRPQTVSLRSFRPDPIMDQKKPIGRNASISKPLMKLTGGEGDEYLSRLDDRHLFRPILRQTKSQQKRRLSSFLHESWSTDSTTSDCALNAKTMQLHAQRSGGALRRRQDGNEGEVEAVSATASACRAHDGFSSVGSFANFRTFFRQKRQQLAKEQEVEDDTWSTEELLKDYSHPLWHSENESDVGSNDVSLFDRKEDYTVEDSKSPENTMNVETEKTEQEQNEITRQRLIDQNRMLFEGARILQFRQRVCMMLIGTIVILMFYMKIFSIVRSAIFRENNS